MYLKENGRKRKIIEVYNWNFLSHFILNPIKLYDISFFLLNKTKIEAKY